MLISNTETRSELFNTLSVMGILCTEDESIRTNRNIFAESYTETVSVSFDDINRVGYWYPHFRLDLQDRTKLEIWIKDEYIYPDQIQWIEDSYYLYGILPGMYDKEETRVTIIHNDYIFKRETTSADVMGSYIHRERISMDSYPFLSLTHPTQCAYCFADGRLTLPKIMKLTDTIWEFRCEYTQHLDMVFCSNLVGIFEAKANKGLYIDNMYSNRCYHYIMVDNDSLYPIDARFYPCIKVDKDCIVRVYDNSTERKDYPEVTRLVCYPEYLDVADPYNTTNEYLSRLPVVDDIILSSDSDDVILDKLSRISKYCYRAHEKFPFFSHEQPDFHMCDNSAFGHPTFVEKRIHYIDGTTNTGIISMVPFESHRDILFYEGNVFSDYRTISLISIIGSDEYNEDYTNGIPRYVIPSEYDPDKFTIIKFNAAEDTVISNIGDYIDTKNIVELHTKLNRFYRNLLILRGSALDQGDQVRVSTVEPNVHDENLWFELLVNAKPEMFEGNPELVIKSFGLDPDNMPEDIRTGMYTLDLPKDDGPEDYSELLLTYYKLAKAHQEYLVMQADDRDDPRIEVHNDLQIGQLPNDPSVNDVVIDNPNMDKTESFTEYEIGTDVPPEIHDEGDIFASHIGGSGIDDLFNGIGTIDSDEFCLETISYTDEETGHVITGEEINRYTTEQKKAIILRYITEGNESEKNAVKILWESYLETMNEETLNAAVYKVLLLDYIYTAAQDLPPNATMQDDPDSDDYRYIITEDVPTVTGDDIGLFWVDLEENQYALTLDDATKHNLKYIMSIREPDVSMDDIGMLWINIPAVTLQDYIGEMICSPIMEAGYSLPEGFFYDYGNGTVKSSIVFDYGSHGTTPDTPEIFQEVNDQELHTIYYGEDYREESPENNAIWYEFLDEINNRVCYSDTESMVILINERLYRIQFDHDNITAFAFDDIVMNFRGKLGIRYISILADLLNSGVISKRSINIFYKRLITKFDQFEPGLIRLYTGRDHVVSTADIDTTDYSITYSTNIGRYHIDYESPNAVNRERESAWRHVIDYSRRDFAFIGDRMVLFVNGRHIARSDYSEIAPGKIQLYNFGEIISCVDIFYSTKDYSLSQAKHEMIQHWNAEDTSTSIQRPEKNYDKMHPMCVKNYTYRGVYDVLLEEYIFNHRLERMLNYLKDHPEEYRTFRNDMIQKFSKVSDMTLCGRSVDEARIIIPCFGYDGKYEI